MILSQEQQEQEAIFAWMGLDELQVNVLAEIQQKREEGYDVSEAEESARQASSKTEWIDVFRQSQEAPLLKEYPYQEPETLAEIRAARGSGERSKPAIPVRDLADRMYGGWLGRVAGCILGKPLELGWSKAKIIEYLQLANSYPLENYVPALEPELPGFEFNPGSCGARLGEIRGAVEDDDTDYTVLGLHVLETYGLDFSTEDVAAAWLRNLPIHRTWTAERAVYRNLVLGIPPAQAARVVNPYREYIGARIRIDAYGFAAPGDPERAARMAYQDAALSHTKNGIYSAMFTAACLARAFVSSDLEEIVCAGLAEIPQSCRMAEAVREVLAVRTQTGDWEAAYDRLFPAQDAYNFVHAINNTVWLVLALLYGEGDFEKTITRSVLCGFDTDCNCANAGAILGVIAGAGALPAKWIDPLEDTLLTSVALFGKIRISELARRTAALAA